MAATIPRTARFRRAEGLHFDISLCTPDAPTRVMCRRHEGDRSLLIRSDAVALLGRLGSWQTTDEAGASHARLCSLVDADLVFWSSDHPDRNLTNSSLRLLEGKVALARNVSVLPLLGLPGGQITTFPFMARRGWLDHAMLVGALFETREMDMTVSALRTVCCARHGALLRDLIPRLDGTHELTEFDAEQQRVIAILDRFALLERRAVRHHAQGVTWLGHAGILYAVGGQRILIDPLLHPISTPSRGDTPVHFSEVGKPTAVLVTHGDNDHLNPQSLYTIPRSVPVIIPRTDTVKPYQVDMRRVLVLLGFTDIREVGEWERIQFGDVVVMAAPFRGEDWGLHLAARTYVVASPDLTIYANADSTSDADVHARVARDFAIDLAFVGMSGAAETYCMPPGYGYGDFYAPWISQERRNEWVQLCNGPREAAEAAIQVGARHAFGYAAGGASYHTLGYVDRGSHAEVARHLSSHPGGPLPHELKIGVHIDPARLRGKVAR